MKTLKFSFMTLVLLIGSSIATAQTDCVNFTLSQDDIGAASETFSVKLADFDGDGWRDVVAIHAYDAIEVYFNNGDGTFNTTPDTYGDDSWRFGVEVMDIENDGDWDFIAGPFNSSFGNGVEVWENNGNGIFSLKTNFLTNAGGYEFAVGDLNGDGYKDIFFPGGTISIMLNDGNGNFFSNGQTNLTASSPEDVTLNDFDGDGDLDAVLVRSGGAGFVGKYYINNGTGQFLDSGQELSYGNAEGVGSGDIDGDGDMDVVIAPWHGSVYFFMNDGFGNFLPGDTLSEASEFYADVILKDINFDGNVDIISDRQIWLNDTENPGTFIMQDFEMSASTHDLDVNDINNDGLQDIYLGRFSSDNGDQVFLYDTPQYISVDTTLCFGDSIYLENAWQTEPGNFIAYAGCDTLANITLSFYEEINTEVVVIDGLIGALLEGAEYQWLDCDDDFAPIPGATEQTYLPDESGNYAVEITTNGMCVDTSDCHFVIPTDVVEMDAGKISIYPNPALDLLTIEMESNQEGTLKLFDFTGRILKKVNIRASKHQLDISALPAGIYYLQVDTGSGSLHRKIIKE
jgi:hypothetical protein